MEIKNFKFFLRFIFSKKKIKKSEHKNPIKSRHFIDRLFRKFGRSFIILFEMVMNNFKNNLQCVVSTKRNYIGCFFIELPSRWFSPRISKSEVRKLSWETGYDPSLDLWIDDLYRRSQKNHRFGSSYRKWETIHPHGMAFLFSGNLVIKVRARR